MVTTANETDRQTVNMPTAFRMLGISRPVGYELARRDALPMPIIRLGNRVVVSRRALEAVLDATKDFAIREREVIMAFDSDLL